MADHQQESVERQNSLFWQMMPHDLKLEEIIKASPPKFVYSFDFFIHLIHLTIEIPAKNKTLRRSDGYVPLHSSILQRKNKNYHLHLEYLVDNNILQSNSSYQPGIKARMYRIHENYLKDSLMEIMVSDKNLIRQLAKQYRLDFKVRKKYQYLQKWFDDKIAIDVNAAMVYCGQIIKQVPRDELYQVHQQVYGKMLMIKMLQHRQFWFTVDKFGQRLHTNFTNLSSDLRKFVKYDGQNLVSVDIKNSQPFLGLFLLSQGRNKGNKEKRKTNHPEREETIMLLKQAETLAGLDVQGYENLVIAGKLYDFMEVEMRKAFGDKYFSQKSIFDLNKLETVKNTLSPRERVKLVMFQIFFSKNSTHTKEKKLFAKLFPTVMKVYEDYKGNKTIPLKRRHKELAKELQRIESKLMLDKVAKEISKRKPELPLFTIHDSVVTTEGNEKFIEQIMNEVILAEIGFAPTLKVEVWKDDSGNTKLAA